MKKLADIVKVYEKPLTEYSEIRIAYSTTQAEQEDLKRLRAGLETAIEEARKKLGVDHIRTLNLPPESAQKLRETLKSDPRWQKHFQEIVQKFAPEISATPLDDLSQSINLPWWNATPIFRTDGGRYSPETGSLDISAAISHSFISQLTRSEKYKAARGSAISVSNVLITSDGLIVLGLRGGQSYANTIMTVPAGSIEFHSGNNPFFETLYAEFFEETGLTRKDIVSAELIGEAFPYFGKQPHYIFRSRISPSYADLLRTWTESIDQREHMHLIGIPDDPNHVLELIRHNSYDPEKSDPINPAKTTIENASKILPQCAASLLINYAQREGSAWGTKAEGLLNGAYVFK